MLTAVCSSEGNCFEWDYTYVQVETIISLLKYFATFRNWPLNIQFCYGGAPRIAKRDCIHFSLYNNEITRGEIGGAATNIPSRIFVCPPDILKRKDCNKPIRSFSFNLLKTKRNLLYIRNQFAPRSKHFPPRL